MSLTYLLPLRRDRPETEGGELACYLRSLAEDLDVIVVDGSPAHVFAENCAAFGDRVSHIPPAPDDRCANGKTWGVRSGLRVARSDCVVIADDDVRWDASGLARALTLLQTCDMVVPQNFFSPMTWHCAWDTGRTLLNRALAHDWPGTLVCRRSALPRTPAYCGDALFENCELVRTVRACGGRVVIAADLFVARRPPTLAHFVGQRPRQAYDDHAQPLRMAAMLAVLPLAIGTGARRASAIALAAVVVAEVGRRRRGGAAVFPWYTSLCAPLWLGERGVLSWWAVWLRVTGRGVSYAGQRLLLAAHGERALR